MLCDDVASSYTLYLLMRDTQPTQALCAEIECALLALIVTAMSVVISTYQ